MLAERATQQCFALRTGCCVLDFPSSPAHMQNGGLDFGENAARIYGGAALDRLCPRA